MRRKLIHLIILLSLKQKQKKLNNLLTLLNLKSNKLLHLLIMRIANFKKRVMPLLQNVLLKLSNYP